MADVCARVAPADQDSAVSCSGCSGSATTSSGNGSAPHGAYVVHLAASTREPVNLWLDDSASAFLHGSNSTVGAHRQWTGTDSKPATQLRVAAAQLVDDPAASPKALEGCSFATHPVTLCFRDRRIQSLFDDQRAACASHLVASLVCPANHRSAVSRCAAIGATSFRMLASCLPGTPVPGKRGKHIYPACPAHTRTMSCSTVPARPAVSAHVVKPGIPCCAQRSAAPRGTSTPSTWRP